MSETRTKTSHYVKPVRFGWSSRYGNWREFGYTHAWCIGYTVRSEPIYGWTLHLGPVKVYFGRLRTVTVPLKMDTSPEVSK